jgi:hypothetical protein
VRSLGNGRGKLRRVRRRIGKLRKLGKRKEVEELKKLQKKGSTPPASEIYRTEMGTRAQNIEAPSPAYGVGVQAVEGPDYTSDGLTI